MIHTRKGGIFQDRETSLSVTAPSAFEQNLHAYTYVVVIGRLISWAAVVSAGMYHQHGPRKILLEGSTNAASQLSVAVRSVLSV